MRIRQTPYLLHYFATEGSVKRKTHIQTDILVPPKAVSSARFELLRAWLRSCDQHEKCKMSDSKLNQTLPNRLLWVGDPDNQHYDPNVLHLDTTTDKTGAQYAALSHCWGEIPTEVKKHFCSTSDNISRRQGGFSFWELPKTFQDAVKVTRELRVPYLWIDSLCIIQYGDSGEDWKREAGRMERVFSEAYCTIAATSASNSYTGFLQLDMKHDYIHVEDASGNRFYICAGRDDFDKDVEETLLNTRAWVMQERVLSRRTIHFSANLLYWECGEGVHCENLTRLESSFRKRHFMLDPYFPKRLLTSGNERIMEFIHFLSEDYSKRGLIEKTDRCVAISGLEARIARALSCGSSYGIFESFLHRNLLWQPSDTKLEKIVYEDWHVPSWSWMAYNGGIRFFDKDISFGTVDWIVNLRFDEECKHALIADVGKFQDGMKQCGKYAVLDSGGVERGWIQYDIEKDKDEEDKDLCEERCVVVGKTKKVATKYYILVVRPTKVVSGEYRRVGVGLIRSNCVVRERLGVRIV
ncbi:HET-domain-containing protein [Mytilinidion resinicola]|uniref:HET-domain-containing protein n=1 Tax=Mytilinidion resinicola TaxID=574789 RepID=A0A6A6YGR3_9PEZI|nr:HET-domain-containing protein [Mytilinidion resinicola]KAF2807991.1 HET-domain-containing protein [Mytilinidion resinicola]